MDNEKIEVRTDEIIEYPSIARAVEVREEAPQVAMGTTDRKSVV